MYFLHDKLNHQASFRLFNTSPFCTWSPLYGYSFSDWKMSRRSGRGRRVLWGCCKVRNTNLSKISLPDKRLLRAKILSNKILANIFSRIKTKIDELRSTEENVIFVNAGDFFQGTIWYTLFKYEPGRYTSQIR